MEVNIKHCERCGSEFEEDNQTLCPSCIEDLQTELDIELSEESEY